jgi:transposase
MLDFNILFRWFLDMDLEQPGLDQSNFSRLRERLVEQNVAHDFFDAVVGQARAKDCSPMSTLPWTAR